MRRVPEIDSVRGLAAAGIVVFHYTYPGPLYDWGGYTGQISLEVFFVLSGFLITGIVLKSAGKPGFLSRFYLRRSLRIWPIYYLFLFAAAALVWFRPDMGSLDGLVNYLTFTQESERYWGVPSRPFIYICGPMWSLALEEQFYVFWPVLVLALGPWRRQALPYVAVAVAAGSLLARHLGMSEHLLPARADGLALGGLLACLVAAAGADAARLRPWLVAAAAAGLAYMFVLLPRAGFAPFELATPFAFTAAALISFGVIGLVATHAGHRLLAPLRWRPLVALGTVSYGVYLYHLACLVFGSSISDRLGLGRAGALLVPTLLCLAVSAASWFLIEAPILRLKDRFEYPERAATEPPAPVVTTAGPEAPAPVSLAVPETA